jgi:hypothetical protein
MTGNSACLLVLAAVCLHGVHGADLKYDDALDLMIQDRADQEVLSAFRIENEQVY